MNTLRRHHLIVAAVGGSASSAAVVRWSLDEAALRHCQLRIVTVVDAPAIAGYAPRPTNSSSTIEEQVARAHQLDRELLELISGHPIDGAKVQIVVSEGLPAQQLIAESAPLTC